ncbi:HPr family phosphocarrier protein [Aliikangiella marina]|uniref:HPr family phosphocarrier protein n=1 Tax=Aliikangiella marina TaxID=1712262 RepID=A0A545T6M5_9GAMM|nr:HPr family phosphocarrier protein [Aliikangiella marina]TQV72877.1 HPr family phosphocarrier protein [Aliikangiella marina]
MGSFLCEVTNQKGMHARAAAKIVALVDQYECEVTLTHQGRSAPGNSLIKLLTLNAPKGSVIKVECYGADAAEFSLAIKDLFNQGFGE